MNKITIELSLDDRLILSIVSGEIERFVASAFYKLRLKYLVDKVVENQVIFNLDLTYIEVKKIVDNLSNYCNKNKLNLYISETIKNYINEKEHYIEIRSRLGIEIKQQDAKLHANVESFAKEIDKLFVRKLRDKQIWDAFFLTVMKKASNFSVPGAGKTASVLGMYAYLNSREQIKRLMVVCPKNAFGSWIDEFQACFGWKRPLVLFNIHDPKYKNLEDRVRALKFDVGNCNLFLINYEAVQGVINPLKNLVDSNTLLVFDEVHKVKRIDGYYAKAALKLSKNASYIVAMTGTPIPNKYTDIYNLLNILYSNEYKHFFNFTPAFLASPNDEEIEEINNKIQPFFCRTTKKELGVPPPNEDEIFVVVASENEKKLLDLLKLRYRKDRLALLIRILQLESSPKLLAKRLDIGEFDYLLDDRSLDIDEIDFHDFSMEYQSIINETPYTTKFLKCLELVKEKINEGKTIILWCMFKDTIENFCKTLNAEGISAYSISGEVALEDRAQLLKDFKEEKYKVLVTNPHTLAESVSLHQVCHDAIYFEYSYNLVHMLQSKDRIHRLGLPEDQYTQYYFMATQYKNDDYDEPFSLGLATYDRLKEKEKIMLDAIDADLLEIMPTTEEDLNLIFENL